MKVLSLLLIVSTSLTAGSTGMYGAPWATRPRPETTHEYVIDQPPPSNVKRALTDRVWKPGVFSVGLLSAVGAGAWYLRGQEAEPVSLATQSHELSKYSVVNLFSAEPAETHVQVWQEGHSKLDWRGELNGSQTLNVELLNGPVEISITSEDAAFAELVKDNEVSFLPLNQAVIID